MVWRVALLVALVGCRFNFTDEQQQGDAAVVRADSSPDAHDVCAQSSTILCEDFTTMPTVPTNGDVQWFASGGHSGGALQARGTPANNAGAHWTLPAITSGPLNARVYLRVQAGASIQMFLVTVELNNAMATNGQEKISVDLGASDTVAIGAPFSGGGPVSTTTVVRDRWTCVELRTIVDGTAGEMHLFLDGTEIAGKTGANTLIPTGFHELILSSVLSSSDPATIVDYDDLVVAYAPIGC